MFEDNLKRVAMKNFLEKYNIFKILDYLNDGVLFFDKDWLVTKINTTASEILEGDIDKILNKNIKNIIYLSENESRLELQNIFKDVIENGEVHSLKNQTLYTLSNNIKTIDTNISPIYDHSEIISGAAFIFSDVTGALKKNEKVSTLEKKVERLERIKILGSFLSGVSYNFTNIISRITKHLENIEKLEHCEEIDNILVKAFEDIEKSNQVIMKLKSFNEDSDFDPMPYKIKKLLELNKTTLLEIIPNNISINTNLENDFYITVDIGDFDKIFLSIIEEVILILNNSKAYELYLGVEDKHVCIKVYGEFEDVPSIIDIENVLKRNSMSIEKSIGNNVVKYKLIFKN